MGTRTIELGPNQNKRNPKEISLMALLANSATGASRRLLIRHGEKDASNHKDLELKLAEFYAKAPDKKQIEKEFAEIHPHKDFILKNLAPVVEVKNEEPTKEEVDKKLKDVIVDGGYSNCGGNCNCPCSQKSSNACGCSAADGSGNTTSTGAVKIDQTTAVLGLVAIVALVALVKRNA